MTTTVLARLFWPTALFHLLFSTFHCRVLVDSQRLTQPTYETHPARYGKAVVHIRAHTLTLIDFYQRTQHPHVSSGELPPDHLRCISASLSRLLKSRRTPPSSSHDRRRRGFTAHSVGALYRHGGVQTRRRVASDRNELRTKISELIKKASDAGRRVLKFINHICVW